MPGNGEPLYRVVYPELVQKALLELYGRAAAKGRGEEVLAAARVIDRRLQLDPRAFGEPRYSLHEANLDVFVRVVSPLLVFYAVHESKHLVFVRKIETLPSAGI